MIDATLVSTKKGPREHIYRFTFVSVVAGGESDEVKFQFDSAIFSAVNTYHDTDTPMSKIEELKVSCVSEDYNISLRSNLDVSPPSVEEVYLVENVTTKNYYDNQVNVLYHNDDYAIYMVLGNNDGSNATGLVTVEFTLSLPR